MSPTRKVPDMFAHSKDFEQFHGSDPLAPALSHAAVNKKPLTTAGRRHGFGASRATCGGFSLVELLVSIVVLSVIMGAVVTTLATSQEAYNTTELQSDMYENVRGAAELMAQEVGQAGTLSLPATTLSSAVVIGTSSPSVSSTTSMFVGELLQVDGGNSYELVSLTGVSATTITASFAKAHAAGAPITVVGVFPSGIVPPTAASDASTSVAGPAVSVLNLFGDINADGSLVYVRYTCDTSVTPGTLTRSVTTITPGNNTINTAQTLLSTLIVNPSSTGYPTGVPCFQYTTLVGQTQSYVTNVGLTISVRSLKPDPHTGHYLTMTKSFLDLSPRNLLAGFELDGAGLNTGANDRLQLSPPNVSLY